MKLQSLFALLILGLSCGTVHAQVNLKDLRVKPDSVISENKQENISLKNIRPIVPKLELQVDYWKHWTRFGININQAAFNDDWKGGGVGSTAVGLIANHKSDYTRDNFNFVTEVDLRYGKIKNKSQIAKKNNDRIFWDNKLSYKLSPKWALYTSLTFESQFDDGFKYTTKDGKDTIDYIENAFMAPAYITESLGFEYKPSNSYSIRFGTGTARQTLILDNRIKPLTVEQYSQRYPDRDPIENDQERFGVEGGKMFKNDLAFQITGNMDKNFTDKLNVKARYNLFANYKKLNDPSHRLDVTVTAKVSRAINVNLNGVLIYDSDIISRVQLSETLALGLVFNLPR
ncbi:hypothetical protein KO02_00725 [Sphingobacterium sp. ML3W]|uniref:DUF3078 domain-containing protein n=1 Tax=Sphingobacterium TaxID=28453 RepID=UPI0004F5F729|nr:MULTISPECIES: DUF3078 domain-containing protein [Sphingobacterium]AIM35347.1 hypothetical protein KO02_00725 [Sphingobacterium sp. ML3W]MDH5828510.1 DUF3078 domain-containing protein [Sphingobacterium faecium]